MSAPFTVALAVGQRVAASPHTDSWMAGDRYGTVVYVGRAPGGAPCYRVRMERSGRSRHFDGHGVRAVCRP